MKHIVLVNAHWNNRGDEAAIRAIIDSLLQNISDICITIIFKEKGDIVQFPYSDKISYITSKFLPSYRSVLMAILSGGRMGCGAEMKKIVQIINNADCVIYAPGGAVVCDRFWWKKQLEYLFPIAYAEKRKIPVFFAAPSVGPFQSKKIFRKCVLRKAEKICVRENISCTELEKQGVKENVLETIDSAFLNKINEEKNQKVLEADKELRDFIVSNQKVVGITVTDLGWHVEYGRETEMKQQIKAAFSEFINWLGENDIFVLLIPQLFGNQNDKEYLQTLLAENVMVLSDEYDAYFQQYVISKLHAIVGMRYHSNIFAAKMGVPFIPIIYEEKMEGFVVRAGWQKAAIALRELSVDMLKSKYTWIEQHHEELIQELEKKQISWRCKAEQTETEMLTIVNNLEKSHDG